MVELGRGARTRETDRSLLDTLSLGSAYERRLALVAQFTWKDGGRVLRATADVSSRIRALAFLLVPKVCDDLQALEALKMAHAMRREGQLLLGLVKRQRQSVVDAYLDWLTTQHGVHGFADVVPLASAVGLRKHLPRALERPSRRFWARLARFAPTALSDVLAEQLRAVEGVPDPVTRQLLDTYLARIADQAPTAGLTLADLLLSRGVHLSAPTWRRLAEHQPVQTVALLQRHAAVPTPAGIFARRAHALDVAALQWLVMNQPASLGDARLLLEKLPETVCVAVAEAWCAAVELAPAWGTHLLKRIPEGAERDRVYARWSRAMQNADGIVALEALDALPESLREREARRHMRDVVALEPSPQTRIPYAWLLPWDEALDVLQPYLGHPEGSVRGLALAALLSIPSLRPDAPEVVDAALAMILSRKNEQDTVRRVMLHLPTSWPRRAFRPEHTKAIGQILRDALDAADLSYQAAFSAEQLLIRTFRLDAEWGARWLGTFIKERGGIEEPNLGEHLSDEDLRLTAPQLLTIARAWSKRGRGEAMLGLASSLGSRIALVAGLQELLESVRDTTRSYVLALGLTRGMAKNDRPRFEASLGATMRRWFDQGWEQNIVELASSEPKSQALHPELIAGLERVALHLGNHSESALMAMRRFAVQSFDMLVPRLLKQDASTIQFSVVRDHLHRRRQDLLGPYLDGPVIHGKFATGTTRWLLPFDADFFRWTEAQCTAYSRALAEVCADPERDTPALLTAVTRMAALDWAPMEGLCALVNDSRPVVQERALRVMARCDQGQGAPTLVRSLEGSLARIAIYGLRRAFHGMPPARVVALLADVPLTKVTVAKEVVRLLGEMRSDAAYARLVELDAQPLHRDVRIALLRALWDHLDREPTWGIFERAATGSDMVMATRVGDIPADRLTAETDTRLSAVLALVLARPEPEARIELLQRAPFLAIRDRAHVFLDACGTRIASPYDIEVQAATTALLTRSDERVISRLEPHLRAVLSDRRALQVATSLVLTDMREWRPVFTEAARIAERVVSEDPRLVALRVRCAAAGLEPLDFAARIAELGEAGLLDANAQAACHAEVERLPLEALDSVGARLRASSSAEARRVALGCLVRDAGPRRGWTPEKLAALETLQADPSPLVSGAAQFVFPPRELAAHARLGTPSD
ncbi:hypothetical protein JGU66_03595 [Myxococcaceae bacterium JPH2]|nr:hypothetical protein [Myxococcaceae bacterium JPH2]